MGPKSISVETHALIISVVFAEIGHNLQRCPNMAVLYTHNGLYRMFFKGYANYSFTKKLVLFQGSAYKALEFRTLGLRRVML